MVMWLRKRGGGGGGRGGVPWVLPVRMVVVLDPWSGLLALCGPKRRLFSNRNKLFFFFFFIHIWTPGWKPGAVWTPTEAVLKQK